MDRRTARALLAAGLLALAPAAPAARGEEPPAPDRVALSFGFPAEGPVRFVRTLRSRVGAAPGSAGPAPVETSVVAEFSLELAGKRKDGSLEVLLGYGRIRFASESLPPGAAELRSDRALPKEGPLRAAALPDLVLGGTSTALLLDPSGRCVGATEDSLEHGARTKALGLDRAEAASLPVHLSGPRLLREYGRAMGALPVPAEPVAIGGTFGIATPVGPGAGRSGFYASQTLTVTGVDADAVSVEGKGRVAWADDERARKAGEPLPSVKVLRSSVSSKFRISRKDGMPLAGAWEVEWAWQEKPVGEESFHRREGSEKAALERVAAWPSGGK